MIVDVEIGQSLMATRASPRPCSSAATVAAARLHQTTERWVDSRIRLPHGVRPDGLATILVAAAIGIHIQAATEPGVVTVDDMVDQLEALVKPLLVEPPRR
ncbi:hypothetical protein [Nocardia cyriacigeorgica]|uniref:MftR C-terminal domain-containing protein n=1 Tax=Nocardia cyriacigeorgica TaxID=135487 RepID=A0A5R8NX94_9NOCA|nr:hypothetical protein [Nocardia cyriacigeorgica]TLF80790.1 hypothetical protein FEK34_03575 [Nocardia cyriacigeorgica]